MSVFIITLLPSREQILAGVPRYLTITSNVPSTIYYTLDGTVPNTDSPIYIDTLTMPVVDTIVVNAFGVDGFGNYSPIITQTFGPFFYSLDRSEGLVINGPIIPIDQKIVDGFNADDQPSRFLDIPRVNLEIVDSNVSFDGEGLGDAIPVLPPDEEQEPGLIEDSWQLFSSPEKAQFFNPYAKNIIIDGRKNNELFFLNRPFGSMRDEKKFNGGKDYKIHGLGDNYISGGFVRHMYSEKNQILVSYYKDANNLTTVKSIQPYTATNAGPGGQTMKVPLVFQWIPRGRQQSANI